MGERIAATFLSDHGLDVVRRNLEVAGVESIRGELDLLALDRGQRVVIEVRAITSDRDPIDAIGPGKRRRVSRLAGAVGAARVDFLGIRFGPDDVVVHWVPGRG
jgi:Holliday junction resolvase-like predicted endonuclease